MIEQAENVLRDLGFYDVRVRHHELGGSTVENRMTTNDGQTQTAASRTTHRSSVVLLTKEDHAPVLRSAFDEGGSRITHLARIEVGSSELPRLVESDLAAKIATSLKRLGYAHVTVDLQGYRRGSMNESSVKKVEPLNH